MSLYKHKERLRSLPHYQYEDMGHSDNIPDPRPHKLHLRQQYDSRSSSSPAIPKNKRNMPIFGIAMAKPDQNNDSECMCSDGVLNMTSTT